MPRDTADDGLGDDVEELEDPKMDLGDQWGMKRMLDEKAMHLLDEMGYSTDWRIWNVKMLLGTVSCACAGIAQFWPGEYPQTKWVLLSCCAVYYLCGIVLQYIATFMERYWFVFTHPKPTAKWSTEVGIALSSTMERYEYEYTLCVEAVPSSGLPPLPEPLTLVKGLNEYFDSDGYLAHEIFENDVEKLIKRFEVEMEKALASGQAGGDEGAEKKAAKSD